MNTMDILKEKLSLEKNPDFIGIRRGILDPNTLSLEERNQLIKEQPAYGNIICRCEMITEGEIIDSIKRPLGATTLDGIKRRTRAMMGGCQGTGCMIPISMILSKTLNIDISEVNKNSKSSTVVGFKED